MEMEPVLRQIRVVGGLFCRLQRRGKGAVTAGSLHPPLQLLAA